jgi:acyl dehydratase
MPYLEDHEPGSATTTASRTIFAHDISAFTQFSGDWHPIHADVEYAKRSAFGGIVAHGPLVLTVAHGLMARSGIFDEGAAVFLGLTWRMTEPVRPDDTLHVQVVVHSRRESRKDPSRGIVEFAFRVINQHGVMVGEGIWSHLFAKRPAVVAA